MYFQMPQIPDLRQEHYTLQSPAYLRDLLSNILAKHPSLSPMIPSMMILVDGVSAAPSTVLKEGDEVDLKPSTAGG
jgi:molybdopterin converting factor small subunit